MPRYIELDDAIRAACKVVHNQIDAVEIATALEDAPTADVAPKSEVEELKKAYANYEETTGLKQAKQEVAREIFAEIEKAAKVRYWKGLTLKVFEVDAERFAELKKKYIGEQNK